MPRRDEPTEERNDNPPLPATYPTKLVNRIMQESFANPNTRINADALAVVAEYLRLYTREAIWRAGQEREKNGTVAGMLTRGVLEVEDLERIAGPLNLDFS
jgi:hypothetical protein